MACVIAAVGFVVQYRVPGRRLSAAGIPGRSSLAGVVLGIVGFFVVPFIGLPLGFVLGVFLAELARRRQWDVAWRATVVAVKAAVLSVWIELMTAVVITLGWACVAVATA